jgi:hypothetical protein
VTLFVPTDRAASIGVVTRPTATRMFYITPFFIAMPPLAQLDFPMCADITVIPECSIFWPTGAPPHRGSPGLVAEIAG